MSLSVKQTGYKIRKLPRFEESILELLLLSREGALCAMQTKCGGLRRGHQLSRFWFLGSRSQVLIDARFFIAHEPSPVGLVVSPIDDVEDDERDLKRSDVTESDKKRPSPEKRGGWTRRSQKHLWCRKSKYPSTALVVLRLFCAAFLELRRINDHFSRGRNILVI